MEKGGRLTKWKEVIRGDIRTYERYEYTVKDSVRWREKIQTTNLTCVD